MKQLLIIGARGRARGEYNYMHLFPKGKETEFEVKGFLDDKADALDGMDGYPPIIEVSRITYHRKMMYSHVH